jgi:hypothetical protein
MRAAIAEAGGDGGSLAVLTTLPKLERLPALVEAGVTDFLVYARVPDSYDGALDVYAHLVAGFREAAGGG